MTDAFGTLLQVGDVVVQDARKERSKLRVVVDIDPDRYPDKVRLGDTTRSPYPSGTTWVGVGMLAKYFDQGIS